MSVNNKHLATFLLGAAAAFGAYKYMNMSDEEKEKLAADLKNKANKLRKSAMEAESQAADYFHELKNKGAETLKEYMPKVDEFLDNFFKGGAKTTNTPSSSESGTPI